MPELKLPHINHVMVAGRLVDDPHRLEAKDKTPGASFTIASNRWVKGKVVSTAYLDVIAWDATATAVLEHCGKGSPVLVTGSLANREKTYGKSTIKVTQISAQTIQFLAAAPKPE